MGAKVEIAEAKGHWDELVARARSGEEIVLAEGGNPVARITSAVSPGGERLFGEFVGKIRMADDFASPLADDELAEWEK